MQNAATRVPLVSEQIERVAVEFDAGDFVLEGGNGNPVRFVRRGVREGRDEDSVFRPDVRQDQQRVLRTGVRQDVRHLNTLVLDAFHQAAFHQDGIVRRVGSQPVKPCLAVEITLRRVDPACQLVVEESPAVIEPLRIGVFGVENPLGKIRSIPDLQHVQHGVFAAVPGDSVDDVRTIGGRIPPVQREVAGRFSGAAARSARFTHLRRVDQYAVHTAFLHEQLVVVRALGALFEEQPAASASYFARRGRISGELLNVLQERPATGDRIHDRACVLVLALEVGKPARVFVVLHPPVRIAERLAKVGVLHDVDSRHRRGRNIRPGQHPHRHDRTCNEASGSHQYLAAIDLERHATRSRRSSRGASIYAAALN